MTGKTSLILVVCVLGLEALAALLVITRIQAAPGAPADGFSIPWWTVDGGGGTSQGVPFVLSGTTGQPDAGVLTGGDYTLRGGFWSGLDDGGVIYLPMINR